MRNMLLMFNNIMMDRIFCRFCHLSLWIERKLYIVLFFYDTKKQTRPLWILHCLLINDTWGPFTYMDKL